MTKIAIYGAGGHGRELAWLAGKCKNIRLHCFIDDHIKSLDKLVDGVPVIRYETFREESKNISIIVGLGYPRERERISEKVSSDGFRFINLIYPDVEMSSRVRLGNGVVICAGSILTTNIEIGNQVQINIKSTISHDVKIGDFTTLSPGVHVAGCVSIGKRVFMGIGATIVNGSNHKPIIIGDDVTIAAGACVIGSIPPGEVWGGVPAKKIMQSSINR
jgi:sugar O-acyltransferase (sialic acid O-acetyltransferase NeuD family)